MLGKTLVLRDGHQAYELSSRPTIGLQQTPAREQAVGIVRRLAAGDARVRMDLTRWLAGQRRLDHDPIEAVVRGLRSGWIHLSELAVEPRRADGRRYDTPTMPTPLPKFEPNEIVDGEPSLTRTITLTILDFHLAAGPLVNLPLHVIHDGGDRGASTTDADGTIEFTGLPADRRFAVFSGRIVDAKVG